MKRHLTGRQQGRRSLGFGRAALTLAAVAAGIALIATPYSSAPAGASLSSGCKDSGYSCVEGGYNASTMNNNWATRYYGAAAAGGIGDPPHNCTLYAAWMLARNGMGDPGRTWGNATDWGNTLASITNSTPAIGSIAWYAGGRAGIGKFGHVAYVANINLTNNTVFLESDNYIGGSGGYTSNGWVPIGEPSGYIHAHDVGGGGGGGTTTVPSQNLLKDGSFETGAYGWSGGTSGGMARYTVGKGAPAIAHDGSNYLAFNGSQAAGASVFQDVTVPAAAWQSYTATAWISSQAGRASGLFCVWGLGPNTNSCVPYSATAGTYTQFQVVYDAPQPLTGFRVQFYPGSGTTDIDSVSLVQNLLKDGSFETGAYGWSGGTSGGMARYTVGKGAPAIAHDGSNYLAFNGSQAAGASVFQDVTVPAAAWQSYTATAWISSQAGRASGLFCVWGLGPNTNSCVPYSATAGTYTQFQVVYDAPQPLTGFRVQFYPGSGTTDIDSVSLE